MNYLIVISIIFLYNILNLYVRNRINNSIYLDENRRKLHQKLIWILPFLGPIIIYGFWRNKSKDELDVMTKAKRKQDKSNFYESGKGIYG